MNWINQTVIDGIVDGVGKGAVKAAEATTTCSTRGWSTAWSTVPAPSPRAPARPQPVQSGKVSLYGLLLFEARPPSRALILVIVV